MCKNKRYVLCQASFNLSFQSREWAEALVGTQCGSSFIASFWTASISVFNIPTTLGYYWQWQETLYWSDIPLSCSRVHWTGSVRVPTESNSVLWLGSYLKILFGCWWNILDWALCVHPLSCLFFLVMNKSNISLTSLTSLLYVHMLLIRRSLFSLLLCCTVCENRFIKPTWLWEMYSEKNNILFYPITCI